MKSRIIEYHNSLIKEFMEDLDSNYKRALKSINQSFNEYHQDYIDLCKSILKSVIEHESYTLTKWNESISFIKKIGSIDVRGTELKITSLVLYYDDDDKELKVASMDYYSGDKEDEISITDIKEIPKFVSSFIFDL